MSRTNWQILFSDEEAGLEQRIDQARRAKGMTKKGFFLYGVANMVPELATEIVDHLMAKPHSKTAKIVKEDIEDVANSDS